MRESGADVFDGGLLEVDAAPAHGNRHVRIEQQVRIDDLHAEGAVRIGQGRNRPGRRCALGGGREAGRQVHGALQVHARQFGAGSLQHGQVRAAVLHPQDGDQAVQREPGRLQPQRLGCQADGGGLHLAHRDLDGAVVAGPPGETFDRDLVAAVAAGGAGPRAEEQVDEEISERGGHGVLAAI